MTSVGEILRAERKRQGREIAEIAANLRISASYVNSIERDDLKDLPNTFFYKSFVKQYVETVGLDYQPLRARVEELVALEEPPALPPSESPMDRLRTSLELACSKMAHLKTLLLRPGKIGGLAPHRNL